MTKKHSDLKAAPPAPAAVVVPAGFALVPSPPTPAMDEVMRELDWQWEDLLASAEAITEQEYAASAEAPQAPAAPAGLPSGWAPCVVTHEGEYPEEVAYGPQIMMDRLKKWLDRHFAAVAAAPAQEHATQLAGQGQEPAAWLASYQDREGNEASYVTTHYQLALENDARGQPVALYRGASAAAHKDEQAARALPAGMEPVGYAHAGNLAKIGDGYAYLYPEQAAGASVPVYTAAQVLAMGRVLPEPTSKQIVLMAGAILHQAHGTADTRHPAWAQAVEQAERAYRALVSA